MNISFRIVQIHETSNRPTRDQQEITFDDGFIDYDLSGISKLCLHISPVRPSIKQNIHAEGFNGSLIQLKLIIWDFSPHHTRIRTDSNLVRLKHHSYEMNHGEP